MCPFCGETFRPMTDAEFNHNLTLHLIGRHGLSTEDAKRIAKLFASWDKPHVMRLREAVWKGEARTV